MSPNEKDSLTILSKLISSTLWRVSHPSFHFSHQIRRTRLTSIVIPKKSLSNRHNTTENSDKATLPKWVPTEKIPWTIIIIIMFHLLSSLERWYLLYSNIFRHPKTKCLETRKWKNGFNGVPLWQIQWATKEQKTLTPTFQRLVFLKK